MKLDESGIKQRKQDETKQIYKTNQERINERKKKERRK
jgi:hypothetical protein